MVDGMEIEFIEEPKTSGVIAETPEEQTARRDIAQELDRVDRGIKDIKTKRIKKKKGRLKSLRKLKIQLSKGRKEQEAKVLRERITRTKLLQQAIGKGESRSVNILRRVEDRIPNTFTTEEKKRDKSSFFSKGGIL